MTRSSMVSSSSRPHLDEGQRALAVAREGLELVEKAFQDALSVPFQAAVQQLLDCTGRVIVTGMGKSGHIGRKIAATLASTGTPASFVHPAEASHGDLGMIQSHDVVLALSWSGETVELANLIAYTRRFSVPLIAMTSVEGSALAREADVALVLPKVTEACPNGLAPTTSTLVQLAVGDALAVALLAARGFSAQDFRVFHPGGKLGAQLRHVRDVMHKGKRLPVVSTGTLMSTALIRMSEVGLGCVGVCDEHKRLLGIVTDGDLRRHMAPDLLGRTVDEVMTGSPKTISPDDLAVEALERMNTSGITTLFVVEHDKAVGLVHVHDLLRLGVI